MNVPAWIAAVWQRIVKGRKIWHASPSSRLLVRLAKRIDAADLPHPLAIFPSGPPVVVRVENRAQVGLWAAALKLCAPRPVRRLDSWRWEARGCWLGVPVRIWAPNQLGSDARDILMAQMADAGLAEQKERF